MIQLLKAQKGSIYALFAFFMWGTFPVCFKLLNFIAPEEILIHRMIWSTIFCLMLLLIFKQLPTILQFTKKDCVFLFMTSILLVINWFFYILAVNNNKIVEASMGYFICPLIGIFLGIVFLREKPSFFRTLAILFTILGVGYLIWQLNAIPYYALILSISFALYGFLKKYLKMDVLKSFSLETIIIFPFAFVYFVYFQSTQEAYFNSDLWLTIQLMGLGIVTSVPLILFSAAAKHLKQLTSLSFYQFITPTCQLIIGVIFYYEPFTIIHLISFGCIWIGLALMVIDSLYHIKKERNIFINNLNLK